ncbi:hypothetical protein D3C85_1123010 [compost metagenome]
MKITEQTTLTTRKWFADNVQACIDEAVSGEVRVNDLPLYIKQMEARKEDCLAGAWDHTLTFKHMAVYIQTGNCYALLP